MPPLTSLTNLPTKMAANYGMWADTVYKINEIHSFCNSHSAWSIIADEMETFLPETLNGQFYLCRKCSQSFQNFCEKRATFVKGIEKVLHVNRASAETSDLINLYSPNS